MNQEIKKILPVVFLILSSVLAWQSWQEYSNVSNIQNQINDSQAKTTTLTAIADKVDKFVAEMKANPEIAEKMDILLSDGNNKVGTMSFLTNLALSNGLLLQNINFTEQIAIQEVSGQNQANSLQETKPLSQDVKMTFSGNYSSLKNFLAYIEKSLKLTEVVSIDFKNIAKDATKDKEKSQNAGYDFSLGLKTFYMDKSENLSQEAKIVVANNLIDLSFVKQKQFIELTFPQNYNIDTADTGDWGNKNIF